MIKVLAVLAFIALNFYTYHYMARVAVVPSRESFSEFPLELGEWRCAERLDIDDQVRENLGATDVLLCDYNRQSRPRGHVSVYVGFHESQVREEGGGAGENSIHPPAHCLPGSGWDIVDSSTVPLDLPGLPQQPGYAKRLVVAKGKQRNLVYYWYQSRGRVISEDWQKIIFVGWDRAWRGRTDGSLVRFTIPIVRRDTERAERDFRDLSARIAELLSRYVPV